MKNGEILPAQCRAARALISMSQKDLAAAAGLGQSTVIDFERERRQVSAASINALRATLEKHGVSFIDAKGGGVGVCLRADRR
ncbi:Helix-turn-helix [Roseivivax halotolerans]|uniref:Helix-turn-helix n=2 Tax=Roseivivax halotolerans TaxID=93684 RepID=A0A1I5ZGQ8_9RHOB|nr:Helix-turn-helix [Roseivivax halotolerans]